MVQMTYEKLMQMTNEEFVEFIENELPGILEQRPHLRPIIYQSFMKAFTEETRERLKAITSPYGGTKPPSSRQKKGDID